MSLFNKERTVPAGSVRPRLEELESRNLLSVAPTTYKAASAMEVASGIIRSTEALGDFITGEYARFLNRAPDAAGFQNWLNQMEAGLSPQAVEAGFVASPEYFFDHGGNTSAWLTALYHDLLGRAPDSTGFNFWLGRLQAGESTSQVALGFSTSLERDIDFVTADYSRYLNRTPDSQGLNTWVTELQNGASRLDVLSGILGSQEYFTDHGHDANSFVTGLYNNILGRVPNSNEVAFWVNIYENPVVSR